MTIYTLTGFSIRYNEDEDAVAVASATLAITFPNSQAFIRYTVLDTDGLPEIELGGTYPQRIRVDGSTVGEDFFSEAFLGNLTFSTGTTTFLSFFNGATNTDYLFRIGGAAFTPPTSLAQLQALENSVTGFGVASGAFAPNQNILISSFSGVETSNSGSPGNTINGSNGDDLLQGTVNDETIVTGNATPSGDIVFGSIGNDTIDMRGNDGVNGFVALEYGFLSGPGVEFVINGVTNTAVFDKRDLGIDTLLGVAQPLNAGFNNGGLGVGGTNSNDTFDVTTAANQWILLRGGGG